MKTLVTFLFACFLTSSFSQNISPEFSELKGMEDQSGNSHLFYRIYTYFENEPIYEMTNHIYHLDLLNEIDTLFLTTKYHSDPITNFNTWVSDVDYWDNNPAEFIYCGGFTFGQFNEGGAYVQRFDGFYNSIGYIWGSANYIDIKPTNDSLLYLGVLTYGGFQSLISSDGGRNWDSLLAVYQFLSLNPYHENIFFVENENRELLRTTDNGTAFTIVDPEFLSDSRFYYDIDGQHIYRLGTKLKVSDNLGAENSWEEKYYSSGKKYLSVDYSTSGTIYLSNKNKIYCSSDYGDNFVLYKTLDRNIVGIYKKPDSDKLYAATEYCIYEISSETITVIKRLPSVDDLNWYPLAVGNLWVYEDNFYEFGNLLATGYSSKWISGIVNKENGKNYFVMNSNTMDTTYLRIDSLTSKVYAFDENTGEELLYEDLIAESGDSVCYEYQPYWGCQTVYNIEEVTVWDSLTIRKDFASNGVGWYWGHSLVKNFGLFEVDAGDVALYYTTSILYGCVINGIVYGDTSVVSAEDETPNTPTEFSLSQNYPNPFNPSTKIKYSVGANSNSPVQLKVYDVLGNEIATLVNEEKPAGKYEVEFDGTNFSSGIYFYQLNARNYFDTKKMILLK